MTADSIGVINVWLAVLACASLAQLILLVVFAVLALRMIRRAMVAIEAIETRHIGPLAAKLDAVLTDVHDVAWRVQRADDAVRLAARSVDDSVRWVATLARLRLWPMLGAWRAMRAGAAAMRQGASPGRGAV